MNSKKEAATPESRDALYKNMGKTVESFTPILKESIIISKSLSQNIENEKYNAFEAFLSLNIYVQYMNIELSAILRACFRANSPVEKRYNIKWINCLILEGYKHLYGYGRKSKKSLWVSKIKPLLNVVKDQEFQQDVVELENRIVEFGNSNTTDIRQRNLSFHYDFDPVSVYNMLTALSEEEEVQRMNCFMSLLQDIASFISEYIKKYVISISVEPHIASKYMFSISNVDIFRDNKDKIYSTMEDAIQSHSKRLETMIRQQHLPEFVKQRFKDVNEDSMDTVYKLIEIQKVGIQLTYLYLDLAAVTKAFISSEFAMERQLVLKQINTIIFEGYNKIYGLSDDSEDSFWKKHVFSVVLNCGDDKIIAEFETMEERLLSLKSKIRSFNYQRQLSVHFDMGIPKVYDMLHSLSPIDEFKKILELLGFLPEILNFLKKCIENIGLRGQINHENRMKPTYDKIDNLLNLLENAPDTPQKKDIIKILEDFKSGEFINEIMKKKRNKY